MKKRKIEKLVLKSFDDLYETSVKISKKWNKSTVPVKVIEEIANILIANILIDNTNKMDLPELSIFKQEYEKMMRQIVKSCKASAKKMDSKSIPRTLLKTYINTVKKAFKESFNG